MFVLGVNEFLCVVLWIMCSKWSDMVVCILSNFFLEQEFMCGKWSQFYNNYSVFIVTLFVKWAHDLEHHLWIGEFYDSLIGFKCSKIAGWLHKIKIHGCFLTFFFLFLYPPSNCFWNCYLWIRMGISDVIVFFYCDDEG